MPHLVANGTSYPLGPDTLTIGRDKSCRIYLPGDPHISRYHAAVVCIDGRHYLKDGDGDSRPSLHGTRVNGQLIRLPGRKLLKHNDRIDVCTIPITFHDDVPQPDNDSPSTVILAGDEADESSSDIRPEQKYKDLVDLLRQSLELDVLLPRVLDGLLGFSSRAERSFVILVDRETGKPDRERAFKTQPTAPRPHDPYNRKLVEECLSSKQARCSTDPVTARSAVCAPLLSIESGSAFGVLLVDNVTPKRPFSHKHLSELEARANLVATAFAITHYHEQGVKIKDMLRELELAADLVRKFLPEKLPTVEGYEFFAAYEPVLEVGGDYYDFIPLGGSRLGILVADVEGHGVPAALVMSRFSAQVQACLRAENDLARAVGHLNALAQSSGRSITLGVLQLDTATHTVTMVNAGHPPLLLLKRATGIVEAMDPSHAHGLTLGAWDEVIYQSHQFTLQPGETVILYSDGIDAAMGATDEKPRPFGTAGIRAALAGSRAAPPVLGEQILRAWDKHAAGCRQHDDITLVCFGRSM